MRDVRGGDAIGDGGYGFGGGGGNAWWGFAFIVFIIFAIIIAFAWLSNKNDRHDGGLEKFLPLLGLAKDKFGGCDYAHTELVKDQAKDTGEIIHNQDLRAYDLKASQDANTYKLERRIDELESSAKDNTIAELRAKLGEECTKNTVGHAFGHLSHEIAGIKEHFKPGWFEYGNKCG